METEILSAYDRLLTYWLVLEEEVAHPPKKLSFTEEGLSSSRSKSRFDSVASVWLNSLYNLVGQQRAARYRPTIPPIHSNRRGRYSSSKAPIDQSNFVPHRQHIIILQKIFLLPQLNNLRLISSHLPKNSFVPVIINQ